MSEKIHVGIQERWWLLRHLNPEAIDVQLSLLNEQRAADDQEAIVYFIPHQYSKEAVFQKEKDKAYNNKVKENNDLRSTLHYYLFIKATEPDILALVSSEWNRAMRLRLTMCRSKSGEPLWAATNEMDDLIALMREHREMFNLEASPDGFQVDDRVMLKAKVFEGREFYVTKVRKKAEGASLTLEYPIFNGRIILKTESVEVSKQYLPMKIQDLLSPDYVKKVDQALTGIVRHRYGRRKSPGNSRQTETDAGILHDLQFMSYMEFDDSQVHNHVRTLLLLHAVLRKDRHTTERYIPIVEQMLPKGGEAVTDEDAFMMAVLYLATRDVSYRDAAKRYEQSHKQLSEPLSQLMPVIKYVRFRDTPKKKITKKLEKKLTKQIAETMRQISDCDFSSLSPEGALAVFTILTLPPYDTEEGHALQSRLKQSVLQTCAAIKSQLSGDITSEGKSSLDGSTIAECKSVLDGGVTIDGKSSLDGGVTIEGKSSLDGSITSEGKSSLDGGVTAEGKSGLEAELTSWQEVIQAISGTTCVTSCDVTQSSLIQARSNLLRSVHPSASALLSYYNMLVRLHPDRTAPDSADLYQEYLKILLASYSRTHQFTTSWWQLKSVLERYYTVPRHLK